MRLSSVPVNSALRSMKSHQSDFNQALTQISTGKRINRAADDPSGLIAASGIRQHITDLDASIAGNQRTSHLLNTADGVLAQFQDMLLELTSVIQTMSNADGLSDDEKQGYQDQVSSLANGIDRLLNTTEFNGQKLFDGSTDFLVSAISKGINVVDIFAAALPPTGTLPVDITVTQAAEPGRLFMDFGANALDANADALALTLIGNIGSVALDLAAGSTTQEIADTISEHSEQTGVEAEADGNTVTLASIEVGEDAFVSVDIRSDGSQTGQIMTGQTNTPITPDPATSKPLNTPDTVTDHGQSVAGIVNGQHAKGEGNSLILTNPELQGRIELTPDTAQNPGSDAAFDIVGGGVKITAAASLQSQTNTRYALGVPGVENLQTLKSDQPANILTGDLSQAQDIARNLSRDVAFQRARIGAKQKYEIDAMNRVMSVEKENSSAALSAIEDTDYAKAIAQLNRSQLLMNTSQQALSIAMEQQHRILDLLAMGQPDKPSKR